MSPQGGARKPNEIAMLKSFRFGGRLGAETVPRWGGGARRESRHGIGGTAEKRCDPRNLMADRHVRPAGPRPEDKYEDCRWLYDKSTASDRRTGLRLSTVLDVKIRLPTHAANNHRD